MARNSTWIVKLSPTHQQILLNIEIIEHHITYNRKTRNLTKCNAGDPETLQPPSAQISF